MPQWNDNLEGSHLKIASHSGCTMRVVAGPGTGKSFALQRKAMRLLQEGVNPERILAVTFTNVAADALKKDLGNLDVPGAELINARTLHSLCFEILQREQVFSLTGRFPRPLMEFENEFLVEDLSAEFGGKKNVKSLLLAFESAFARGQHDIPGAILSPEDARFQERLVRWLKLHRAMLIGELVPITYDYLKNNPEAPELTRYEYVLADEYQDLNKAEQLLIDLLSSHGELVIVGDEDQSIYSFKHAHPDGIREFPNSHSPLEDVSLKTCRRCPKKIVRLANELMGYQLGNNPKKLEELSSNEDGEVYAVQWRTAEEESSGIAKLIKKMISDKAFDIKAEDILILSPRRQLGYLLRDILQDQYAIASHTFFQEEALESLKAFRAYSFLNYLVFPNDRVTFRILIGTPTALPGTYEKILRKSEELSIAPIEVIKRMSEGSITLSGGDKIVERFKEIEEIVSALKEHNPKEIIESLFDSHLPEDIEVILSVINSIAFDEETDLKRFFLTLQERIRSPEVTAENDFVRIMSLHKSKGLTAKVVFILSCVAGLVPTIKDEKKLIDTNQVAEIDRLRAEAKRLFFVAITRSKKYLILSSFGYISYGAAMTLGVKFRGGGKLARTITSPFFGEVSKHLPQVISGDQILNKFRIEKGTDT